VWTPYVMSCSLGITVTEGRTNRYDLRFVHVFYAHYKSVKSQRITWKISSRVQFLVQMCVNSCAVHFWPPDLSLCCALNSTPRTGGSRVWSSQMDQVFLFLIESSGICISLLMCDDVCGYQFSVPISLVLPLSLMNCAVSLLRSLVASWTFDNAFPLRSVCMANMTIVWPVLLHYIPFHPVLSDTHVLRALLCGTCFIISEINVKWPSRLIHAAEREISFIIEYVLKY
jgi:hypothetical protein